MPPSVKLIWKIFNLESKMQYELRREWTQELTEIQGNIVKLEAALKKAYR